MDIEEKENKIVRCAHCLAILKGDELPGKLCRICRGRPAEIEEVSIMERAFRNDTLAPEDEKQ